MTKAYKELGPPELLTFFVKITGGYIQKPRDARMLAYFMDEHALVPIQLLAGMIGWAETPFTQDIPSFLRNKEKWLEEDIVLATADVAQWVRGETFMPQCYWIYRDLLDEAPETRMNEAFEKAKQELEQWNDAVNTPASLNARGRAAQRGHHT